MLFDEWAVRAMNKLGRTHIMKMFEGGHHDIIEIIMRHLEGNVDRLGEVEILNFQ